MNKTTIFIPKSENILLLFNKDFYNKSVIRDDIADGKDLILIDNYETLGPLPYKNQSITRTLGFSLNINLKFFRNNFNNKIYFFLNTIFFSNTYNKFLLSLRKVLLCLSKFKKSNKKNAISLVVLKAVKSGFICIHNGAFGFFPVRGVITFYDKLLRFSLSKTFKNFFFEKNFYKSFLTRLPCFYGGTRIYTKRRKKRFVRKFRKKLGRFKALNFIFLLKLRSTVDQICWKKNKRTSIKIIIGKVKKPFYAKFKKCTRFRVYRKRTRKK